MPVYLLEFYFLNTILAIWMMSDDWLKATGIDTIYLPDYAYILILVFVFWYNHVGGRVMLFIAH